MDTKSKTAPEKKIALVTGASRGLGYETSILLAKRGIHVIALARTVGALENLSDQITKLGGSGTMVPIDITNYPQVKNLGSILLEKWKKVDYFVHLAAMAAPLSPTPYLSLDDFDNTLNVNARATLHLIQIIHPALQMAKKGQALFVDDNIEGKFFSSYAASKAASRAILKSYRRENKRLGPKVTIFKPSPMPTALRARFFPGENRTRLQSCASQARILIQNLGLN
ncbi:MAG: SDR family oxidoreductase [Pseudomonadota bacterium]|nr:SDR family oxidoreductase [Pseudomonadota bacterium]